MKISTLYRLGFAITAILAQASTYADTAPSPPLELSPKAQANAAAPVTAPRPGKPKYSAPTLDAIEPAAGSNGLPQSMAAVGLFGATKAVTPASTTLSPPVSIVYSGSSPAISINDSGSSKAVQAIINNTSNTSSALYGQTNGAGGGVTGYNGGTSGFAGKFGVTNNSSSQPSVLASTTGTGPAILATATNSSSGSPAVYGKGSYIGVQGDSSGYVGVWGNGASYGMVAESTSGVGLYASTDSATAIYAVGNSGVGIAAYSDSDQAIFAQSTSSFAVDAATATGSSAVNAANGGSGRGVTANSKSGVGIYASSGNFVGVWGHATNGYGVYGEDLGSGTGVYGLSVSGFAGYFDGKVGAKSYVTVSDRNAKNNFKPVDGRELLARVNRLPITTWDFKGDDRVHHMGPMAQDFHAQFGLNGSDDKHINLTDIAGVSLAAIQELTRQGLRKDAKIAALQTEVESQKQQFAVLAQLLDSEAKRSNQMATRLEALERGAVKPQRTAVPARSDGAPAPL